MRSILLLTLALLSQSASAGAVDEELEKLYFSMKPSGHADNRTRFSSVVPLLRDNADCLRSKSLWIGAVVSFELEKFEDFAFYFFASDLRFALDVQKYEPTGKGGNSPALEFGALRRALFEMTIIQLAKDPDTIEGLRSRLIDWKPIYPQDYDPGWEFADKGKPDFEDLDERRRQLGEFLAQAEALFREDGYGDLVREYEKYKLDEDLFDTDDGWEKFEEIREQGQTIESKHNLPVLFTNM